MSDSGAFCPKCGEVLEDHGNTGRVGQTNQAQVLCDSCYLEDFELVNPPAELSLVQCTQCGAIQTNDTWIDPSSEDITDIAIQEIQDSVGVHIDAENVSWAVQPEQINQNQLRVTAVFTGWVRGERVEEEIVVPVSISRGTCSRCGRIAGNYYAGVVQVRASDRELQPVEERRAKTIATNVVSAMRDNGDRDAFLTEITAVPGGIDIKVSTTKIGERISRRIIDEFGGTYSTAETLVTEDEDGNEVYRVNHSVRLPRFVAGDIINPNDGNGPVLVESNQTNLKGIRLTTGDAFDLPASGDVAGIERVGSVDQKEPTTLVSIEDEFAIQVLDPDTYQPKTIPYPSFVDEDAKELPVVKIPLGLFAVPNE